MKKVHVALITLLLLYAPCSYAFPTGIFDDVAKFITKLFSHNGDDAARMGHSLSPIADDVAKLGNKTPEQMFAQYEALKNTNENEAYWWLHHAALKGSIVARKELDKQCQQAPATSSIKVYCGKSISTGLNTSNYADLMVYRKSAKSNASDNANADHMFSMYEKYKNTNSNAAYYWLNQAGLKGSVAAQNELNRECGLKPQAKDIKQYCVTSQPTAK